MPKRMLRAGLGGDVVKDAAPRRADRRQAALRFDPMPERVEPCLALLKGKPPASADWSFEVKWDGYRLAVHIERGKVRIITRGGHDWTHRFPTIEHDALALGVDTAILDGEAVVLDERGASDFNALQKALGGRGGKRNAGEARLYAFDLLYLDGRDLRALPQSDRRWMLGEVLGGVGDGILLSADVDADGADFLKHACAMGLEGIIAKRRDAPYRSGRGGEWLKIKCVQSEGFVVVGYERSSGALGGIGRLLLAARKGDDLVYVGGVGTGFTQAAGKALRKQMEALVIDKPAIPMAGRKPKAKWLTPALIAEVEFRAWTDDGKLRHASYKGLREEADAADVYAISP